LCSSKVGKDARAERQKLYDKLIGLIPQPPELKDLLEELKKLIDEDKKKIGDGILDAIPRKLPPGTPIDTKGGGISVQHLLSSLDYVLTGNFNFHEGQLAGNYGITGSFHVNATRNESGFVDTITSGTISVRPPVGPTLKFPIDQQYSQILTSTLTADAAGNGTIHIYVRTDALTLPANLLSAIINPVAGITLPITIDAQGHVRFRFNDKIGKLFSSDPWLSSDYDKDGALDLASDYAAFLDGWAGSETLADSNFDGVWDQTDIDLWLTRFQRDLDNQ